ncbi:MAG: flavodoxin domain-containing protein, partial [Gammaproteobacteria bacterium]
MATPVTILVGTTTGNAQYCAEEAQFRLDGAGIPATIVQMDGLDASAFAAAGVYLVIVSTYGQGDV